MAVFIDKQVKDYILAKLAEIRADLVIATTKVAALNTAVDSLSNYVEAAKEKNK